MAEAESSRLQQLFARAVELPVERRDSFLRTTCGGDAALLAEVEALLAAHEAQAAAQFLVEPAAQQVARDGASSTSHALFETVGTRIGPYRLLEQIGEGGFGTVFLAEQSEPVRRRVALKIIKLGMDTRQVIARFEAERQALAILDHPSIAKVFDAGTTATGRPYFVMELVRGSPITVYCDRHKLSPRQRLELFIPVCQAVQHAHTKGIIHRDLKPTNVLVTEQDDQPVPKVIDFGVAKATQARLTEQTLFTEFRQMVGTPAYMSPEQASVDAMDVDTRADVYSLGVLLYELLTGTTPIGDTELRRGAYDEMRRMIREVEPPKPSTRLGTMRDTISSVAAVRNLEPRQLSRSVRGELDWIVMKCLEKDRARRYETASALAADVTRHLSGEAIVAGRSGALYRMKKSAARHRMALAVFSVFLLAAATGAGAYIHGIRVEQRKTLVALEDSKREAAIAEAVSRFQSDMLNAADPRRQLGAKVTVLQVVTAAVAELDAGKLEDQPLVESAVRTTIGGTLQGLGRFDEAIVNLKKALDLRRKNLPADDNDIARSLRDLGWVIQNQAQSSGVDQQLRMAEAEGLYREALEIRRRILPAGHKEIGGNLNMLGIVLLNQHKLIEAEQLLRESLKIRRAENVLSNLGEVLREQGKLDESERVLREAVETVRKAAAAGDPQIAFSVTNLGLTLQEQGKRAEAESLLREALDIRRKALPPGHPDLAASLSSLGLLVHEQGKLAEAEPLFRESLSINQIGRTRFRLACLLQDEGQLPEAEALFREMEAGQKRMLEYCSQKFGQQDNLTRKMAGQLARILQATGRGDEAAALRTEYALAGPTPQTRPASAPAATIPAR